MILRVRPMLSSDLDGVFAIEAVAHIAPWSRDILSDCVLVGYDCRVLELESDTGTELVSYIISRYNDNVCHVLNLCVAPSLQGKGFGRILLQDVIDVPAQAETESVLLEVRPSNAPALRLYQQMGFQQVGVKRGYYREGLNIEDAVVLQKQIVGSLS